MSHCYRLLWMYSTWKQYPKKIVKSKSKLIQPTQWLGFPEFESSQASSILGFQALFTYLQAPFPGEEKVSQGPAVCVVSSHGRKRTLPKSLAIGNGWQKEVLSYNGSVCWAEVLSSCNISYRVQNTLRVYSSHTLLLCLQHRLVDSEEICKMVSHLLIYQLKFYIVFL